MCSVMITRQAITQTLIHKDCHTCTYPLNIFDVDISFTLNKLFYNVQMAFFHCHVEGSPLIERRIEISKQVSAQTSQHDLRIARFLALKGREKDSLHGVYCVCSVLISKHSWKTISLMGISVILSSVRQQISPLWTRRCFHWPHSVWKMGSEWWKHSVLCWQQSSMHLIGSFQLNAITHDDEIFSLKFTNCLEWNNVNILTSNLPEYVSQRA